MTNFNVGDVVICIKNPNPKHKHYEVSYGGKGWEEGYTFKIETITNKNDNPIYWNGINGSGVYEDFLQLYSKINNTGGKMGTKYIYQVLTANKKTAQIDKDVTVVAADERSAILKAYGLDVENLSFTVTQRAEFVEDKPQTVIVDKGSK